MSYLILNGWPPLDVNGLTPIGSGPLAVGKRVMGVDAAPVLPKQDSGFAYLKGKDTESEEAQEHANSGSLALYA